MKRVMTKRYVAALALYFLFMVPCVVAAGGIAALASDLSAWLGLITAVGVPLCMFPLQNRVASRLLTWAKRGDE